MLDKCLLLCDDRLMPGNFTADLVTEIEGGLRFNILFTIPDEDGVQQLMFGIIGFRLIEGCILPPSNCVRGRWYTVVLLGKAGAAGVYDALVSKLRELGWAERYPLDRMEDVIDPLIDTYKMKRSFPTLLGKSDGL